MGGNGSYANRATDSEAGRQWTTVDTIREIQVLQMKYKNRANKLPEESYTPGRIYAIFRKDGKDVGNIAKYGPDGKKIWEIHTNEHYGVTPHVHYWKDGAQQSDKGIPLTKEMTDILERVRNYKK